MDFFEGYNLSWKMGPLSLWCFFLHIRGIGKWLLVPQFGRAKLVNMPIYIYIAPDNYLEHRFGNFSVGTRALLRTFSANRGTYVLSDLEHMRILYLEHAIIYTCKYMYMYTYIQLNTAYLYYIYRWCDVALRYMEMSILRYIEII